MTEADSSLRNAIVIIVDRLGSGFLGPYGNTWIETPALNQLASQSILLENMISDSNDLATIYRSYWSGVHAVCQTDKPDSSLAKHIERAGYHATLLTDDQQILAHPLASDFGDQISVAQESPGQLAESVEETQFGQLTLAVIEWLVETNGQESPEPGLLWIHANGMNGPWDAPGDVAERFRDDEDPLPYSGIVRPKTKLETNHDPDDILSVMHGYAAQVAVVDACLGSLLDAISQHKLAADTLLIVTSPRGYPLGEHGYIGPNADDLRGETLQVPLLIRIPEQSGACMRLDSLVQPTDLFATLARWFELSEEVVTSTGNDLIELSHDESAWTRDIAIATGESQRAARTHAWSLHVDGASKLNLYAKPDDRWEANQVADRCGQVPQQIVSIMDQFDELVNRGERVRLGELPAELRDGKG